MLGKNEQGKVIYSSQQEGAEEIPVEEVGEPDVPEEFESYVEQVEKRPELQTEMPYRTGTSSALAPQQQAQVWYPDDAIVLPLTQAEFEEGMQSGTWSRLRWLAEWCMYLIKKHGERVFFKG